MLGSSCSKSVDYSVDYEGDKLVLNGFISSSSLSIELTHALEKDTKINLQNPQNYVDDAVVTLWEDDKVIDTLKHEGGQGRYINSRPYTLDTLSSYVVKAVATDYPSVRTFPISLIGSRSTVYHNATVKRPSGGVMLFGRKYGSRYLLFQIEGYDQNGVPWIVSNSYGYENHTFGYSCEVSGKSVHTSTHIVDINCPYLVDDFLPFRYVAKLSNSNREVKKMKIKISDSTHEYFELLAPVSDYLEPAYDYTKNRVIGGYGVVIPVDFNTTLEVELP